MPTITDNAVVIRCWDFSETSQTVSLFTRDHGIIRGLAKGAKREHGSFSGGMDLLTRGEVVAIVKPTKDLATLTAWHLLDVYRALRTDLHCNRLGVYMTDLIQHMLIDQDPHPRVFDSFTGALANLALPSHRERAVLDLQWTLLDEAGYAPQLDRDAVTGDKLPESSTSLTFSPAAGGVVTEDGPGWRVRPETIQALRSLARGGIDAQMPVEVLRRANRLLAVYFRDLIGKELPTMRWAFPDLTR
jgi:DNA repair protein RecO (recombination protein O)